MLMIAPERWPWRASWAALLGIALLLKFLEQPLYLFGTQFDDQLFVIMAHGFLSGDWSSSWARTGITTLAKPVGYPLFLAGAHFLPWSPIFSVYLLYALAATLIARSWRVLRNSRAEATVILALLLFNPVLFGVQAQRIYRDVYIDALATMSIALAFAIVIELRKMDGEQAGDTGAVAKHLQSGGILKISALSLILGVTIGLGAITKPTWAWLIPAIAAPLAYPVLRSLRTSRRRAATVLWVVMGAVLIVVGTFGVIDVTKYMNKRTYGVSLVEDLSSGSLQQAWGQWARVEVGKPERWVPITHGMRLAVYRISPSAAELKPFLESPTDSWKMTDCYSLVKICNESGPWFEWDLQTAASATGHVNSALEFQQFFARIATDISRACTAGTLRCSSSPVITTGLPPLNQIPIAATAEQTATGLWGMMWTQQQIGPQSGPIPTRQQYALWTSVTPDIPSARTVASGGGNRAIYPVLQAIGIIYRVFDLALLVSACAGIVTWVLARIRRKPRNGRESQWSAIVTASLFFLALLVGMGTLAVFNTSQYPGFILPGYWTDFSAIGQLFLALAAFASWPAVTTMSGTLTRKFRGNAKPRPLHARS